MLFISKLCIEMIWHFYKKKAKAEVSTKGALDMEMLMELTTLQKKVILMKFENEGLTS